jgi:chaperonin GroES
MAQMDTLLGLIPNDIDNKTTVAVIHVGAEDVIANKPYTSAQDTTIIASLISNTNTIISKVEARGWRVMLSDIAFANYGGGVITSEASGALPYTQKVQQAILDNRRNRYRHPDGRSWMDFYYAVKNNYATWLDVDNISLTAAGKSGIRNYIANVLACAQDGVFPIQNPSPQALSAASTSVTPAEIITKLGASTGSAAEKAAARAAIGVDAYLLPHDTSRSYVLGDKVVFKKYSPDDIKIDGEEYLVISENDILAIIE